MLKPALSGPSKARTAILISGRGSNMASLIAAAAAPDYPAAIGLVVSNRPDAAGLARAAAAGIATAVVDHAGFPDRAGFDAELDRTLRRHSVEIVCLAGFMRILTEVFVDAWAGRIINIHPSLLPSFKGLRPHRQALEAGVRLHGCTVHFVVPELDSGPIIAQAAVSVEPGDTEEALAARVLAAELLLYPEGLALVARGEARLEAGRTVFASLDTAPPLPAQRGEECQARVGVALHHGRVQKSREPPHLANGAPNLPAGQTMHAPTPPDLARRTRPEPPFVEFVILVAMMMAITAFAVDGFLPALPAIGASFGVANGNDLQLLVYVYMLGFGLTQLVFGVLSDSWGRRPVYLAGLLIFVAGSVGALLANDLATMLVARFVQGVGAAAGRVLAVTIVRDRFAGREMARVMSLTTMVFITVPIFAPAVGGLILLIGSWRLIFAAVLLSALAYGVWFWVRMPETLAPENRMPLSAGRIGGGLRTTVTSRLTAGYATGVGLMFGCIMSLVGSSQQIFAEAYGLGPWFPLAFGLQAFAMGAASLANSAIVRRFGMRRISHTSVIVLVGCGAAQVAAALAYGGLPPLWLFGILLAASQFMTGLIFPNFSALAMEPLGRIAGTASSLIGFYTTCLGTLVGLIVGRAYDGGVTPLVLGYFVLAAATLGLVLWTERGRLFTSPRAEVAS